MLEKKERALREAIVAAPGEAGPQRVLADLLLDRGDPRGQLIALHLAPELDDDERALRIRAHWQLYGDAIRRADLGPGDFSQGHFSADWKNGFIDAVLVRLDRLGDLGAKLAAHPVHTLQVCELTADVAALEASPLLGTVRRLALWWGVRKVPKDALARILAKATRLEHLEISSDQGAPAIWKALERFPRLAQLEGLSLHRVPINAAKARWLGRACPGLKVLRLQQAIDSAALLALADHATFRLRELEIDDLDFDGLEQLEPELSDDALAAALGAPMMQDATRLSLHVHPRELATAALASLPCAEQLETLELRSLDSTPVAPLLRDCHFPALSHLVVPRNQLRDDDVDALTRFSGLTHLDAGGNQLASRAALELSQRLPRLEALTLDSNPIGSEAVLTLARNLKSLRALGVSRVGLSGHGVDALVESGGVNRLRSLNIDSNGLDQRSLEVLAGGPFDAMERLQVNTDAAADAVFADGWLLGHAWYGRAIHWERRLQLSGRPVQRKAAPSKERPARKPYDLKQRYAVGDVLVHATFGEGVVQWASADRIDVEFAGGSRKLVHGKK